MIIIRGKWIIWKERNNVKYGNKQLLSSKAIFALFVKESVKHCHHVVYNH